MCYNTIKFSMGILLDAGNYQIKRSKVRKEYDY